MQVELARDSQPSGSQAGGALRLVRRGFWLALLAAAGWYIWRQASLKPECDLATYQARTADRQRNAAPPPESDVSDELTAALLRIPRAPALGDLAPPPGWRWAEGAERQMIEQIDLLVGPWDPHTQPWQAALCDYHAAPAAAAAADELAALVGRPFRLDSPWNPRGTLGHVPVRTFSAGVHFLAARARWRQAARDDLPAAWRELRTALWLTSASDSPESLSYLCSFRILALSELIALLNERELPPELLAQIDAALTVEPPLTQVWSRFLAGVNDYFQPLIAATYSRDARGNGRLVFNHGLPVAVVRGTLNLANLGLPVELRSPLWNVVSPLYHDRATVERGLRERLADLARLPDFGRDQLRFRTHPLGNQLWRDAAPLFSPLAGPVLERYGMVAHDLVGMTWFSAQQAETSRRAAHLLVALRAHRLEHGDWPAALGELPARFHGTEFRDPFSGAPFGYRRTEDGFVFYSVGPDGVDNGGMPGRFTIWDRYSSAGDAVFTIPREKCRLESQLVPVKSDRGPE